MRFLTAIRVRFTQFGGPGIGSIEQAMEEPSFFSSCARLNELAPSVTAERHLSRFCDRRPASVNTWIVEVVQGQWDGCPALAAEFTVDAMAAVNRLVGRQRELMRPVAVDRLRALLLLLQHRDLQYSWNTLALSRDGRCEEVL